MYIMKTNVITSRLDHFIHNTVEYVECYSLQLFLLQRYLMLTTHVLKLIS